MAIKIINETPAVEARRTAICRNCGVTIEFVKADLKNYESGGYDGSSDTMYYVPCPKCNDKIHTDYDGYQQRRRWF